MSRLSLVQEMRETYPIVYQASHGQKWGDA